MPMPKNRVKACLMKLGIIIYSMLTFTISWFEQLLNANPEPSDNNPEPQTELNGRALRFIIKLKGPHYAMFFMTIAYFSGFSLIILGSLVFLLR